MGIHPEFKSKSKMKIAYIAHPIGGDVEGNLEKIKEIVRDINLKEFDVVPFAPYFVDCCAMDDSNPVERARGIKNDTHLMNSGFIDELRLYGNKISAGMRHEIELASANQIPILAMSKETEADLKRMFPRLDSRLDALFKDLFKGAYDSYHHKYDFKEANQIIRTFFENQIKNTSDGDSN